MLAALAGSDKPFIYTGGIWSYGDTGGAVVDETTPPKPIPRVQWRRGGGGSRARRGARRIRTIVIRPAIVYGRGGGIPAEFSESARKEGAARVVGTGENRWTLVHVDDLADLYLLALEQAPGGHLAARRRRAVGEGPRSGDSGEPRRGADGRDHRLAAGRSARGARRVRRRARAGPAGLRQARARDTRLATASDRPRSRTSSAGPTSPSPAARSPDRAARAAPPGADRRRCTAGRRRD